MRNTGFKWAALALVGWLAASNQELVQAADSPAADGAAAEQAAAEQAAAEAQAWERATEAQQTQAHIDELTRLEARRNQKNQLEARRRLDLMQLRNSRAAAWSEVLRTNWHTYQALRVEAANSPSHTAPCTICDGRSSLPFCLICNAQRSCIRCNGVGRVFGEPCPVCRGTRKCFLCGGSGKMPCLFCDDGLIHPKVAPRAALPVPAAPPNSGGSGGTGPNFDSGLGSSTEIGSTGSGEDGEAVAPRAPRYKPVETNGSVSVVGVVGVLVAIFACCRLAPKVVEHLNSGRDAWAGLAAAEPDLAATMAAEDEAFNAFAASFRLRDSARAEAEDDCPEPEPVADLWQAISTDVTGLRTLFSEIVRSAELRRETLLVEFRDQLRSLKLRADRHESRSIWQLAYATEGLVTQLTARVDRVTASALRTVAGAVDMLEAVCSGRARPDLATSPPPRFLAVDDDPICRRAISLAMQKSFSEPELAADGAAALARMEVQSYDVIFLDVEMPGMDGFELCQKIRQTTTNRATPVVFVTSHSDFQSRAKSSLTGGQYLLAKPFLPFEIAVSALCLVMRTRLQLGATPGASASDVPSAPTRPQPAQSVAEALEAPAHPSQSAKPDPEVPAVASVPAVPAAATKSPRHAAVPKPAPSSEPPKAGDLVSAFANQAQADLNGLRQKLDVLRTAEAEDREDLLAGIFVSVHSLAEAAGRSQLKAIQRVAGAVEKLFKKILERPETLSESVIDTTRAAFDLLEELYRGAPPVVPDAARILVVDDDPICLRAICSAAQLAFLKPESAGSGDEAVALAAEHRFDLIFMDVMMPGINGFTACERIRETVLNQATPVIFVTSRSDSASREQSTLVGDRGYITKPVLASEIRLATLVAFFRGHLDKLTATQPTDSESDKPDQVECEVQGEKSEGNFEVSSEKCEV